MPTSTATDKPKFERDAPVFARASWLYQEVRSHMIRNWRIWVSCTVAVLVFHTFFKVGVNVTDSLPEKVFVVSKFDHNIHRGDYASFVWHGTPHFPKGIEFVKIIRGVPGDLVEFRGRRVYINGEFVSDAKEFSLKGEPLALGPAGVIPPGKFYVNATNKNSLDSRYALTGWIDEKAIIGRAFAVF